MTTLASLPTDANYRVIPDGLPFFLNKRITFIGGTVDAIGDVGGTLNPFTIFTVTGDVIVQIFGVCVTNLAGATATLEVGIPGDTAGLIQQTTAENLDARGIWIDNTPGIVEAPPTSKIIAQGFDIIGSVGTADITAGVVDFYCFWRPLSQDGLVAA